MRLHKALLKEDPRLAFQSLLDSLGDTPRPNIVARDVVPRPRPGCTCWFVKIRPQRDARRIALTTTRASCSRGDEWKRSARCVARLSGAMTSVLRDLHMPGLDGFDVIREIPARERLHGEHLRELSRCRALARSGSRAVPRSWNGRLSNEAHQHCRLWVAIGNLVAGGPPRAPPADMSGPVAGAGPRVSGPFDPREFPLLDRRYFSRRAAPARHSSKESASCYRRHCRWNWLGRRWHSAKARRRASGTSPTS